MDIATQKMCSKLNKYLMDKFDYRTEPAHVGISNTIAANRKHYDLYFRCHTLVKYWPEITFVIARLHFTKVRVGQGRDLLHFIRDSAPEIGFTHIGIEMANDNASSFAEHMGFEKYKMPKD